MAFKATLSIDGKEFDVQKCSYQLRRDVDAKGRPSSDIYGGTVDVTIESTEDTSIIEAMVNQFKPGSGSVVFNKGNEESKMKELIWENGYIVDFKEDIDVIGKQPMMLSFKVSAQILKIGGAQIEQSWPTDK
ncbi:MAG: type VI secretion system tube protein TssD [Dysgonomonas sp.]